MQLTKFTHSCVRFDDGDRTLVLDPGAFSEVDAALDGADAIFVTHEHFDHIDVDKVRAALAADSRLRLYAPAGVTAQFGEFGEQVVAVEAGRTLDVAGFEVKTFGGQHAVIHPTMPVIANVAALIGGAVYHPGDSLIVPPAEVGLLLLPVHAPWSKTAEVIDFAVAVRAARMTAIHEALLTAPALQFVESLIGGVTGPFGSEYVHVDSGDTLTV